MRKKLTVLVLLISIASLANAQDFGFGFDDAADNAAAAPALSVKIDGGIEADFLGYVHDFKTSEKLRAAYLGDMVSGNLNFSASGANVDAYLGFNLSAKSFTDLAAIGQNIVYVTPLIFNEAYLRAFFGPVNIEAGYRKMFWGKADSLGPLDVINPMDYSDLTKMSDLKTIKIARPLLHAAWNIDGFSKLEAVFVPNFSGHRFAQEGRWAPSQFDSIPKIMESKITSLAIEKFLSIDSNPLTNQYLRFLMANRNTLEAKMMSSASITLPETAGLEYFQAGLRFTTSAGGADLGAQYYYGLLPEPSWQINSNGITAFVDDLYNKVTADPNPKPSCLDDLNPALLYPYIGFDRFHQIGIDYAQVLFDFNIRAEFAAHITKDLDGTDGAVKNPFLAWSLGFDRDIYAGIKGNFQCNETIRLFNNKIDKNPLNDFEAGTRQTSTRLTMVVSRNFLKDNLECMFTAIWDIENSDCYLIPSVVWNIRDIRAELSAGILAGKESGDLGQYWENSFIKLGLKYSF